MSILFSFVDFCAKSIFFYDIYVKEGLEKKNIYIYLILVGLLPILINFIQTGKKYTKNIILTVPSFVLIFVFILLFYFLIRRVR
jgi:hypothetical protein